MEGLKRGLRLFSVNIVTTNLRQPCCAKSYQVELKLFLFFQAFDPIQKCCLRGP